MSDSLPMWGKTEGGRFVAPAPRETSMALPSIDAPTVDVAGAWESKPTVQEIGTPVHRSVATLIRTAPVMVLLIVLGAPLSWWALGGWDWAIGVGTMAGLGLVGVLGVLLLDLQWNSPSSTERHRIDKAFQLQRLALKQAHETRRAVVEAWIEHLNGGDHA